MSVRTSPGAVIGSYRILHRLAEGGMGIVYAAEHITLGRRVALKQLRPEIGGQPRAVAQFFEEARAAAQLRNPHIVEVYDLIRQDSAAFCVMELLEGLTLAQLVKQRGPLPLAEALAIAEQVAVALGAAHTVGLAHQDVKPSNIFLLDREPGRLFVKLLDFGIARLAGTTTASSSGGIAGTPIYASPEQAGEGPVDIRSDVYSLGVVLYEMLTGQPPFHGKTAAEYIYKHLALAPEAPARPSGCDLPPIPNACRHLVMRCLEKRPRDRYASGDDLAAAIRGVAQAPQVEPGRGWTRAARVLRPRVATIGVGLLIAGLVLWLGLGALGVHSSPTTLTTTAGGPSPSRPAQDTIGFPDVTPPAAPSARPAAPRPPAPGADRRAPTQPSSSGSRPRLPATRPGRSATRTRPTARRTAEPRPARRRAARPRPRRRRAAPANAWGTYNPFSAKE